jgi:hypothetical protein
VIFAHSEGLRSESAVGSEHRRQTLASVEAPRVDFGEVRDENRLRSSRVVQHTGQSNKELIVRKRFQILLRHAFL